MTEYLVIWKIDAHADGPLEAALYAQQVQRDPESSATFFEVVNPVSGKRVLVDTDTGEVSEICSTT